MVVLHLYPRDRKNDGHLRIVRPEEWPDWLSLQHRGYLTELMDDWNHTPLSELPLLLDQLAELSIGPLRSAGHGQCTSKQIDAIMSHFFGNTRPRTEPALQQG
jgi:hypothetical protein